MKIQKQLEYVKELRKSGEEQRSQGDKKTAKFLVRPGVFCVQSLPEFPPTKGERGPKVSRRSPNYVLVHREAELITYLEPPALKGAERYQESKDELVPGETQLQHRREISKEPVLSYSPQNGLEKLTPQQWLLLRDGIGEMGGEIFPF